MALRRSAVESAAVEKASPTRLSALIKTLRPHQWVKNVFVLAPIVFHKDVFRHTPQGPALNLILTGRALATTGVFCRLAGAVYTINDLVDVEADRLHPIKRDPPIASGQGLGRLGPGAGGRAGGGVAGGLVLARPGAGSRLALLFRREPRL